MFKVVTSGYITDRATGEALGITISVWEELDFVSKVWIRIIDYEDGLPHREELEHVLHTQDSFASNKKEKYIKRLLRTGLCHVNYRG